MSLSRLILAVLVAFLASAPANAEDLSLAQYDSMKDTTEFQFYIVGVANGFEWANVEYINAGKSPLFCIPPKQKLLKEEIWSTLDRQVAILRADKTFTDRDKSFQDRFSVSLILLRALEQKYPCVPPKP